MIYFIKKFLRALSCLSLIISCSYGQVKPQKITLAADYWCPYNCLPGSDYEGYLVELARNIFAIYDIEVNYIMMPWSDALDMARNGRIDGVIGISKQEGEGLLFPNVPQIKSEGAMFVRSDDDWIFDGVESILNRKLTVILDYNIYDLVREYFITNYPKNPDKFVIEDGLEAENNAIEGLINERSDIFIEDKRVVNYYLSHHNSQSKLKIIPALNESSLIYIAFSKKLVANNDSIVKMFENGFSSLTATGDIKELNLKYGLNN